MPALFMHVVVYAVVNALLVGVWVLTSGSTDELSHVQDDPVQAVRDGFWPLIVGTVWAGALVVHAAAWLTSLLPGRRRRRRARLRRLRAAHRPAAPAAPAAPASAAAAPGTDLAKDAARAAIGLVESIAGRTASRPSTPVVARPGRQWVVVMFTDLVDSTRLAESLGDTTWHEVLAAHRRLVRACVHDHHGAEVGTQGDGFLVRFESPDAAVACAVGLQQQMADARTRGAFVPELRVGLHAGEAVADDNDLVGRVINLAARVTEAAAAGEILVTEPVADHLAPGIALADRGLKPLKGFAQPRHLLAVVWDTTDDETIVLTTDAAERQTEH